MKKTTTENLPEDIKAIIPEKEINDNPKIWTLVTNANLGHFHDFKSSHPAPKTALIDAIVATGDERLIPIMAAVIRGQYDEPADDSDLDELRKGWIASGSSEESFNQLFGKR